jgi:hypothetical protein
LEPGGGFQGPGRTGYTHVLAVARGLTRLELVTEAVRAALEEVAAEKALRDSGLLARAAGSACPFGVTAALA